MFKFSGKKNVKSFFKFGLIGYRFGKDISDDEIELLNRYEIGFSSIQPKFELLAKLKGITILTESNMNFGERNRNHFVLAFKLRSKYQPGFYFIKPLDDELELLKYTIGIGVASSF